MTVRPTPSAEPVAFDDGPVRRRLGLVALATDHTLERDAAMVTAGDDVGLYVTRVTFDNPVTDASLRALAPQLEDAAARLLPGERLDAIAFGCTSASAAIGDDAVRAALTAARPATPCATPTSGLLRACTALGMRRLAVLAPYTAPVASALAGYLERLGLEVTALTYLDVEDDRAIARITPATIERAARAACSANAEALFCSCTALRACQLAPALERALARPVLTSNQVLLWQALRAAGVTTALPFSAYLP